MDNKAMTAPNLKQPTVRDALVAANARITAMKDRFHQAALAADAGLVAAKSTFSRAAAACLAGRIDAELQVRAALDAVDQARAELRGLADRQIEESPK